VRDFGWLADGAEPPWQWDLRRQGWRLSHGVGGLRSECRHVLICDVGRLTAEQRAGMADADRPAWRLIMIGVEQPAERARLLISGCAEALSADVTLRELEARTRRVNEMFAMLPRWRNVGPLTLDLFHRDARRGATWLNLHPREFGVLWRLADAPGSPVTRRELLTDVWRLDHDPATNTVEVHVSRLRGKLARAGCAELVATVPEGGYQLAPDASIVLAAAPPQADRFDLYLRKLGWAQQTSVDL